MLGPQLPAPFAPWRPEPIRTQLACRMLRAGSAAARCSFSRIVYVTLTLLCPSCPHLQPAASSNILHHQTYTESFQPLSWETIVIAIPKHRGDIRAVLQRLQQLPNSRRNLPSTSQPSCLPLRLTHCRLGCQLTAGMTPVRQGWGGESQWRSGRELKPEEEQLFTFGLVCIVTHQPAKDWVHESLCAKGKRDCDEVSCINL